MDRNNILHIYIFFSEGDIRSYACVRVHSAPEYSKDFDDSDDLRTADRAGQDEIGGENITANDNNRALL